MQHPSTSPVSGAYQRAAGAFERTPSRFLQATASSASRATRMAQTTPIPVKRVAPLHFDPEAARTPPAGGAGAGGGGLHHGIHPSIERIVTESRRLLVADELDNLRYISEEQRYAALGMVAEGQHATTVLAYLLQGAQREKQKRMQQLLAARSTRRETVVTPVSSRTSTPLRREDGAASRATSEERRRVAQAKRDRMMQYSPTSSIKSSTTSASLHVGGGGGVISPIPSSGTTTPRRGTAAGSTAKTPMPSTTPSRAAAPSGAISPRRYGTSAVAGRTTYPSAAVTLTIPPPLLPEPGESTGSHHSASGSRSPSPRDPNAQTLKKISSDVSVIASHVRAVQIVPPLVLPPVPKLRVPATAAAPATSSSAADESSSHRSPRSRVYVKDEPPAASPVVIAAPPVVRPAPRAVSPHRTAKWLDDFHQRLEELDLTVVMWQQLSPAEQEELFVFWRLSQLQRNVILAKFESLAKGGGTRGQ